MIGKPKYTYGDQLEFKWNNESNKVGIVEIVDSYGTFGQNEEPSYDIYVVENNTLYKHIRESEVVNKIEREKYEIIKVVTYSQFNKPAKFFSSKWGVPLEAYLDSMEEGLTTKTGVPAWFYIEENNEVIAGLGIIENDFHKRKDLAPNICAVYVREDHQGKGLSRKLLNKACSHLKENGIEDVYLITTHTEYYEKVGFDFVGEIEEDSGDLVRCYHRKCK